MAKKEKTLIIIKPDGVRKNLIGECLRRFEKEGLEIINLKMAKFKKPFVKVFYSHLKSKVSRKLFQTIIDFMCSHKIVIAVLEGEGAVKKARKICGPINPKEAKKGTIRGDFSSDDLIENTRRNRATRNIIHSSGSKIEARREIGMITNWG
ncbi:nucleoside-diphosphate kinase [bacterium (Candidatus Moisslbacteria) CG12_big_fil_rev_8_21_14_0_65_36_11]|nr:nucleoside-diphosphate kinase [Candidatus Kuenenbacteria bacterium]OIP76235.1 MAG: hypothetical protein AUK09_02510 [Parcubacteria group bacterium CG2_30_36_38]PIV46240.1 MAG: nucleoside-diphosphate kinase [bacterium (Candidatus Moisslbacteria) CG02_land_8_20_14_3_00_36_53]PIW67932.1 MAG: nucleoside-diphosphate kinase [bacterium (Candidatus Moisslbacteria) CG12_big_fil_rev_8_21_14_0_65_36_11]PIZ90234.1 MAG: nucleoside-diphosphate kinase [bacterium (Candidatus Moisslbacteria) CG_4_10_14_0_2_u